VEHVIVVDNASDDATVARSRASGCDVVELPRNHGFAVGANAGLRLVETEIVCVVNPDCLVDVATVRRGAELCTDDAVCAVPDFVDEAGVVTAGVRGAYPRRRLLADVARTHNATRRVAALAEHGPRYDGHGWAWPLGACVFLPAAALRRLGGFDEAYFLYMEDVDLGQRWCAAGGRIVSTGTTVRHAEQQGADVKAAARGALLAAARVQYSRRAFGPITGRLAQLLAGNAA
jgi:GT2 family glycosyltransferase